MRVSRNNPEQAGFAPENTGVINAEQTLKLLALPGEPNRTDEDLGIEALHHATFPQLPLGVAYATREGNFL